MPSKPLAGVTVLDLTRLLPGPMCTLQLADMGADAISVILPFPLTDRRRTVASYTDQVLEEFGDTAERISELKRWGMV